MLSGTSPAATDYQDSHTTHSFPLRTLVDADAMLTLCVGGFRYITQAHCSLTASPEWRALHAETSVLSSLL